MIRVVRVGNFIRITDEDQKIWLHVADVPDLIDKLQGAIT